VPRPGARVDRIAAEAGANKQLIYAYVESKRGLFEAVVNDQVTRLLDEVPFDVDDLPGYAAALFDFLVAHPQLERLGAWHALELDEGGDPVERIAAAVEENVRRVADAQAAGRLDATFRPAELLALVLAVARAWTTATPELRAVAAGDEEDCAVHRQAVVEAARRLVERGDGAGG
jgi:AcrR family transcriptional regulator